MFKGYLELGGVPLVNAEATEAYLEHLLPTSALQARFGTTSIHLANGEGPYRTPLLDEAPWVNALDADTLDFYGLYPLDIQGIDDSTFTATATESIGNGGTVDGARNASRSVRVSGVLVGASKLAVARGLAWLTAALQPSGCADCGDGDLRYFLDEPSVTDPGFTAETGTVFRVLGPIDAGENVRYHFSAEDNVPGNMPLRAWFTGSFAEGTALRYGGLSLYDASPVLELSVVPVRRNYLTNPTLRTAGTGWDTSGDAGAAWRPTGGADGNGYLALAGATGAVLPAVVASSTAVTDAVVPAGSVAGSFALRGAQGTEVTLTLSTADGTVTGSVTVAVSPEWARYAVTGSTDGGRVLLAATSPRPFDIDEGVIEAGIVAGDYFDGETQIPGWTVSWQGQPDASPANATLLDLIEFCTDNASFRPFIAVDYGAAYNVQLNWATRDQIDVASQLLPVERHLYRVSTTQGPQVVAEYDLPAGGGSFMQIDFVLNAGPFRYSLPQSVDTTAASSQPWNDVPLTPPLNPDTSWLADPLDTAVTPAPLAPAIVAANIESVSAWTRYYVPIPAVDVADWASSVPTVTVASGGSAVSQLRFRFHPNPFDWDPQTVDPTSYCGEFLISYLPAVTSLTVDGVSQTSTAVKGGYVPASADHLLYGSGGGPMSWPELTCGISYVLTIDVPIGNTLDVVDLGLTLTRRE